MRINFEYKNILTNFEKKHGYHSLFCAKICLRRNLFIKYIFMPKNYFRPNNFLHQFVKQKNGEN